MATRPSVSSRISTFFRTLFSKETPLSQKLLIIGAVLYGVSPIDLIPDLLPWFGFSDDAVVLAAAVWVFWKKTRAYRRERQGKAP